MKNIILLGPKHSGKTSVAKALGEYIDLDEEIQKATGKTPRQLYKEGVEVFQKAEVEAIRNFSQRHRGTETVIAVGGGIVDNIEAINILKQIDAIKVYLKISADTAWRRINATGSLPPFLQTDNPRETHRALHERRAAAYLQLADITIEAEGKTPSAIAAEIAGEITVAIQSNVI